MVVVGFVATLADVGMSPAVVYSHPLTERHIRVSFTISLLLALALAAGLVAVAPYAAVPLRNASLASILRVEALLFVFTALGTTAVALLRRALDFRRLFVIEVGSYVGGYAVVAVVLAVLGFGVWSLVFGILAQAGLASTLALAMCRHPIRPLLALAESRQLLQYGGAATLNAGINYAARTVDSLIVGRWLGASALGLYARALTVITLPLYYLGSTMTGVLFPAMSEIRSDPNRVRTAYLFGVQLTVLMAAPLCAGVVVAAPHLIVGLYGEAWSAATLPLQILAGVGVLRVVSGLAAAVTYSSGNVMAEVRRQLAFTIVMVAAGVIGSSWGITGVSVGVAVATAVMYFAMSHLSLRIVAGRWRDFFEAHVAGLAVGLQVAIVAFTLRWVLEGLDVESVWILIVIVAACAATVPVGIFLLPRRVRPGLLLSRFSLPISRLPMSVRLPLMWMLRLEA
jgi:PST family polysaccharide transporter